MITIQNQVDYLLAHGWRRYVNRSHGNFSNTMWVSPSGGIYRGPHGAWRAAILAEEHNDTASSKRALPEDRGAIEEGHDTIADC